MAHKPDAVLLILSSCLNKLNLASLSIVRTCTINLENFRDKGVMQWAYILN